MIRLAFLVLAIDLAIGQLNYEGNPFTEYTEYIAEESNLSERTARQNDVAPIGPSSSEVPPLSTPQKLYPVVSSESDKGLQQDNNLVSDKSRERPSYSVQSFRPDAEDTSARQFQTPSDQNAPITPARIALTTFLNSKTPEESRVSLDRYLRSQKLLPEDQSRSVDANASRQSAESSIEQQQFDNHQQPQIAQVEQQKSPIAPQDVPLTSQVRQTQLVPHQAEYQTLPDTEPTYQLGYGQQPRVPQIAQIEQQKSPIAPQDVRLTSQVGQSHQLVPHQAVYQLLPGTEPTYQLSYGQQPPSVQPVIRAPAGVQVVRQGMLQPVPFMPRFQSRNDVMSPAMWRERRKRIHGKPYPFPQSRIAPGFYKGPVVVPFKPKAPPVEVIYTKPPGFHRAPPVISNPPVPYEDASGWFPEADHPPPHKDVYYSQLYAQSYDPHYYNYIAATGKIRPHLYWKLGKQHQEERNDDIWSELYRGFKKHGLKNMMTPTFLLGMTLPVVTLMLSALVQKRSIARSDEARSLDQEEYALREYLERLQRAMECYGRSSRDAKLDGC